MRTGRPRKPIVLSDEEHEQLTSIVRSHSLPHGLVTRAKIILMTVEGIANSEIAEKQLKLFLKEWREKLKGTIIMEKQKKTILVVEDEDDVMDYLVTLFEDHDYSVITATNGKKGFEKETKIYRTVINNTTMNDLWTKKGLLGSLMPNVGLLCKLGKQLQVDAILTASVDVTTADPDRGRAKVFLVQVQTKKEFECMNESDDFDCDCYNYLLQCFNKVFVDYKRGL